MSNQAQAQARIGLSAKIARVNWANKPRFIPPALWIFLKRCKVPGTYYVQDLGEIANSDDGSVTAT